MVEEVESDFGTAYYRSNDPVNNLKIKVRLKRVTGAGLVPSAIGYEGQDKDELGMEMKPTKSKKTPAAGESRQDDTEEYTFKWQEKVFSQQEMEIYADINNCITPIDEEYHAQVKEIGKKGGRKNKRMFCYVDHDRFTNQNEITLVTTNANEKPSFLAEKMQNVRRRRTKQLPGNVERKLRARNNLIIERPSEEHQKSAHVVNTPAHMMYIMATLNAQGDEPTENDDYVLCTIKVDINGVISINPDFNLQRPPYSITTESAKRDTFEYSIQLVSKTMNHVEQDRERRMIRELYVRHAEIVNSQVGSDFEQVTHGVLRLFVIGQIVSAYNFDYDNLYVHYFVELPGNWSSDPSQQLSGVTQTCKTKVIGRDSVAYFGFPFEFELFFRNDGDVEKIESLPRWPQIFLEVLSIDTWKRYRTEGYAYTSMPNTSARLALLADKFISTLDDTTFSAERRKSERIICHTFLMLQFPLESHRPTGSVKMHYKILYYCC
ncbi:Meckel syndrome type 1 protein homolog [Anneissia japonica]|uniref:Meckel syndrome type 1 protein homolog n=1 Tax=Anneissia japonica TaxID=1529436 RepID=UPI0014258241|nr:Meckel syndrome type 1 protein homolog [Anneissia japonica]